MFRGRLRRVRQMLQRRLAGHRALVARRVVRPEHAAGGPHDHSEPSRRHAAHVYGHQQRVAWCDRDGDAVRNFLSPHAFGDAAVVLDQRLRIKSVSAIFQSVRASRFGIHRFEASIGDVQLKQPGGRPDSIRLTRGIHL